MMAAMGLWRGSSSARAMARARPGALRASSSARGVGGLADPTSRPPQTTRTAASPARSRSWARISVGSSARMTGGPSRTNSARPVDRAMTAAAALAASTRVTTWARSSLSAKPAPLTTATAATLGAPAASASAATTAARFRARSPPRRNGASDSGTRGGQGPSSSPGTAVPAGSALPAPAATSGARPRSGAHASACAPRMDRSRELRWLPVDVAARLPAARRKR